MKKVGILLIIVILFGVKEASAQVFKLEKNEDYMYKLSWKSQNLVSTMIIAMYKIQDNNNSVLYNVEPNITMFERCDYNKSEIKLDFETYKKINKIIYFGYGYDNNISEEYYFATQFLIFKELGISEVLIVDKNHNKSDYASKEIAEIQKRIQEYNFIIEDYKINTSKITIKDNFIIDNFEIEGENIKINFINNEYEIDLLGDQNYYKINLKSKNKCLPAVYWASDIVPDLVGKTSLCEDDNQINIWRKIEQVDSDIKESKPEQNQPPEDYFIEETIEVSVPSTSQYSLGWLVILLTLGNVYYVFKK